MPRPPTTDPTERVSLTLSKAFMQGVHAERGKTHTTLTEATRQAYRTWLWVHRIIDPAGPDELVVRNKTTGAERVIASIG